MRSDARKSLGRSCSVSRRISTTARRSASDSRAYFELVWNALVGVPFLAPSLMYVGSHLDHHRQATFGTWNDPEYLPLARSTPLRHLGFLLVPTVEVPMLPVRWGVLGPASWVIPPLRRWVVTRASTLVLNPRYRRPEPKGREAVRWIAQEAAAAALVWLVAGGVVAGRVPVQWLLQWYVVVAGALELSEDRCQVIADELTPLARAHAEAIRQAHVRVRGTDRDALATLREVFAAHPGPCDTFLHLENGEEQETVLALPATLRVAASGEIVNAVEGLLGGGALTFR